ncbi:hypothetical protein [Hominifimenecus sp. rT4P-3]|uniref:hypothetical protein n=1 Tax=Hominifimenecus sp. rT4P-3 TaxID=3242979 RepID=UPI003DA3F22A
MNEREFDEMLKNSVPELPPEDVVYEATPWRVSMDRILAGLAMSVVTINILALNHILPTIGILLQLLGFRTLRKENRWFQICWLLAMLRTVCHFPVMILQATIYRNILYASSLGEVWTVLNVASQILLLFCFWRGFLAVQKKAGADVPTGSAGALLIWYLAILGLARLQYNGLLFGIAMIVCFILIIRSLFHISADLEESGYGIQAAAVRISDGRLTKILIAVLTVGIACGYLLLGSYPMDWQPDGEEQTAEVSAIKENLLTLGYPGDALEDLSEEEILGCKEALRVVVHEIDEPVGDGHEVREVEGNSTFITTVYDEKELHLTDVAVELGGGESPRWRIFHHFLWSIHPGFCGTEALQLWPAYRESEGWDASGELSGRVLYDKNGVVYTSPFYSLTAESYTTDSIFWGDRYVQSIFATFSLPDSGERQRGYVAYSIEEKHEGWIVDSWINYVHQKRLLQYPVLTAKERRMAGGWNDSYPFITVQNALQFFATKDEVELLNGND